jgi:hypothetical protein
MEQGKRMNTQNPYAAPAAELEPPRIAEPGIDRVASAQKLVIYSILTYFAAMAIRALLGPVGLVVLLAAVVMGLVGSFRLCSSLGYSTLVKVILMVLLLVPLVSLLVLLILNRKATSRLRAAGYRVGLLGASR